MLSSLKLCIRIGWSVWFQCFRVNLPGEVLLSCFCDVVDAVAEMAESVVDEFLTVVVDVVTWYGARSLAATCFGRSSSEISRQHQAVSTL